MATSSDTDGYTTSDAGATTSEGSAPAQTRNHVFRIGAMACYTAGSAGGPSTAAPIVGKGIGTS